MCGSANVMAPWSQKIRSKLASANGSSSALPGPAGTGCRSPRSSDRAAAELVRAEVQTGDVGSSHRDLDAELARAAAELQRAPTRDVAQRLDLIFGEVADAPGEHVPSVQVRSMALLVRPLSASHEREVRADVLPAHRSSHPPSLP